jgi:hypothetical protein
MIGLLAARLGLDLGKISGRAIILIALVCITGIAFWRGVARIETMVDTARIEARAERDAHWRGEIARSTAEAEVERARLAINAAAADMAARGEIERLTGQITDLEKSNASLPGAGACGIDRERVRLLAR